MNKELEGSLRVTRYRFKKYNIRYKTKGGKKAGWLGRLDWIGNKGQGVIVCGINPAINILEYKEIKKNIDSVVKSKSLIIL